MQVHPAALPLNLVDLAPALLLAARLHRQDLSIARKVLQRDQHLSHRHTPRVVARLR